MAQHTPEPWAWQEARHTGVYETSRPRTLISLSEDQISQDGRNLGHKHVLIQMASVRSTSHADAIYDVNLEIHASPEDEALIKYAPAILRLLIKMTAMARFAPLSGHEYDQCDIDEAEGVIAMAENRWITPT